MGRFSSYLLAFFSIFINFTHSINGEEGDLLTEKDIKKVMEQIFEQHVDKKSVNEEIIKKSFRTYIEQFDPEGTYLLAGEVAPYFNMSHEKVVEVEKKYLNNDYSPYADLNRVIQKSIARAREMRASFEKDPKTLINRVIKEPLKVLEEGKWKGYPKGGDELEERIRQNLYDYLQAEIKRYGEKGVVGYEKEAIALYEKNLRNFEDLYTYEGSNGAPLDKKNQENLFAQHVLKALAKTLDAHTAFFDPQEAYDMRVRLEKGFDGIGIVFQESPQGIIVAHLLDGGAAIKTGQIKVGDQLLKINDIDVKSLPFEKVMELLKGDKNTTIVLQIKQKRGGKEEKIVDVPLKRETIVMNGDRVDVDYEQFGSGIIGRITLHSFYQNDAGITSEKDVRAALQKLDSEGNLRGLILDLRENSGGFLSQAVKVAGLFITNGVIVVSKYSNGEEKIYRDMDSKVYYNGPMVILTSRATASAAEIVAEALQDYGVAIIVGDEQTYGKGTIQSQTVTDKKGGSFFKVTVGKYYTVSGKTPQLNGVKADIVVEGPYAKARLGEEYLEGSLKKEQEITPEFKDPLADIDPNIRPWYLKYYMPTLQDKVTFWRELLPSLKKNSASRLASNKNYQLFLKRNNGEASEEKLTAEADLQNFGSSDLQLSEAINVIKDMIFLQDRARKGQGIMK